MGGKGSLQYGPRWNPFVVGYYDPREVDPETGQVDPQIITIECSKCGATHRATCTTGAVRGWVNRFAAVHMHADALDPQRILEMAEASKKAT